MPPPLGPLLADLAAEQAELRALLLALDEPAWDAPTPSPGWTVLHQVRHLADGEWLGRLAIEDQCTFGDELATRLGDLEAVDAATTAPAAADPAPAVLARWWDEARRLRAALADHDDEPIGWVAGPMSPASFVTARLMETFAHGHDIGEAVGALPSASGRLRHVAHLGVATRRFSFTNRGLEPPAGPVRVELDAPDGDRWTWGPVDAPDRVEGPALDFCLLVTRRRHRGDTGLVSGGADAERWLTIAQCFAGPPSDGPCAEAGAEGAMRTT